MIGQKIARLRGGGRPRILDLFAGCGGLSVGFAAAGFEIIAAVENDPDAAASHGRNFHGGDPAHSMPRDIRHTKPEELVSEFQLGHVAGAFDVIVGGPPCQAFARVGRSKLREIDAHPRAFKHDARAQLYMDYLRYVDVCAPLVVLIENVPDVMNHGGDNIAEEICEVLEEKGYSCGYTLLNAAFYGVPQMRERMFLIGYRRKISTMVNFPKPTHWVDLPPGYEGSRSVALKVVDDNSLFRGGHSYIEPPQARRGLPPAVTAEEAIGDLPPIYARKLVKSGDLRRGARRFDAPVPRDGTRPMSAYARSMQTWPGFEAGEHLVDHVIRYLPRDYDLFARLDAGDQYPEAYRHAQRMFEERLNRLKSQGVVLRHGSGEYERLKASIVPPYDAGKFPNKWRKMWRDQPARTLMAHLGKDGYSHIHYDSSQARTISVREAARLQSFPDGFSFCGTMNPAFRQIGNAVPPLVALALAKEIRRVITEACTAEGREARALA
jgi:DNA (cytosine-5)-methyltransferase 1